MALRGPASPPSLDSPRVWELLCLEVVFDSIFQEKILSVKIPRLFYYCPLLSSVLLLTWLQESAREPWAALFPRMAQSHLLG